jgi:hypothetical protein
MASKQAVTTTQKATKTAAAAAPAAAVKAVRVAKPQTPRVSSAKPRVSSAKPRVSSAKHSKSLTPETVTQAAVSSEPIAAISPHEAISKIAYGYWVARGYRPGNPHEDWIRAEREFLSA